MAATTLTYAISPGQYGHVSVFNNGRLVAKILKLWCLRMDSAFLHRMETMIGFDSWRRLGIIPDTLPRGVTVNDIRDAYLVARDEVADAGDCVLPD